MLDESCYKAFNLIAAPLTPFKAFNRHGEYVEIGSNVSNEYVVF